MNWLTNDPIDHAALTEAQSSVRRFDGLGKAARRLGLID